MADGQKYPLLNRGIQNLTIWVEDGDYVSIDIFDGEEVQIGNVGREEDTEKYLEWLEA